MKRKIVMGLIGVLFLLIVGSYSIFFYSQQPMEQAKNEAVKIAKEASDIERVDDFYWYNGPTDTYFSVGGYTNDERYLYVVIKQNGGNVTILDSTKVVMEDEAKAITQALKAPQEILEARIGIEGEEPFWEVTFRDQNGNLGYICLSVNTGEVMKEYQNI